MDYDSNVKGILQAYMNGAAGMSLDTAGVLIDLPNARNLSRNFSWHQELVGEKIRSIVVEEMDLVMQMELKLTIISEESEEYYKQWLKEDKKQEKSSASPYHMIWAGSGAPVGITIQVSLVMVS